MAACSVITVVSSSSNTISPRTNSLRPIICTISYSSSWRWCDGIGTGRRICLRTSSDSRRSGCFVLGCLSSDSSSLSSSSPSASRPKTRLYVSGLSFRTTEESLRNAFQEFGQLVDVNLVMDKVANRPRGFAFLRYATEEECTKAIEGMHGKFLDGRVIFVEVAKPRSELRQAQEKPSTIQRRYTL